MRVVETLSWAEIAAALRGQTRGTPSRPSTGASIDTRTLEAGEMFFALRGEHTDGHDHLLSATERGASCVVVTNPERCPPGLFSLVVSDAAEALFELGRLVRSKSESAFVAITGSAGKTTAKDFTAELLRSRGPVLATRGNLNNHLGVPLTLARLETEHWAAVVECGMSHPGELRRLAGLLRPRVAAITNVAPAHLEFFESVDEIAAAKAEIFETLGMGDVAVAPANDPRLADRAKATPAVVRLFGDGAPSQISAAGISMSLEGSRFDVQTDDARLPVELPVPGPHAISNFLLAAAIAQALGVSLEDIVKGALRLKSGGNRGGLKRLQGDILLIDDSYNSNPRALLSAVETLALAHDRRRVACIGEMLELGPSGPRLHREAGAAMAPRVDLLLGVGVLAQEMVEGASALPPQARRVFKDSKDLAAQIPGLVKSRDAVLVKGSRGVRMERVVDALVAAYPGVAS